MKLNNGIEISDQLIEEGWEKLKEIGYGLTDRAKALKHVLFEPRETSQTPDAQEPQPEVQQTNDEPVQKVPVATGGAKNGIGFLRELDLSTIMPSGNVPDSFYDELERKAEAIIKKRLGIK